MVFVDSIDMPLLAVENKKAGFSVLCIQSQSPPIISKIHNKKYVFALNFNQKQFSIWGWQYTLDNFKLKWKKAKIFLVEDIL